METLTPHDEFRLSLRRFTRRRVPCSVGAGAVVTTALRIGTLPGVEVTPS
jgi:hypothetical protein